MATTLAILKLLPVIMGSVKAVEEAAPVAGKGPQKLQLIIGILQLVSDEIGGMLPIVEKVIGLVVSFMNATNWGKEAAK